MHASVHAQSLSRVWLICNPVDCSLPGSSVHGIFPGKNIVVGCHSLLQGIFPTQGSNSCILHLLRWPMDFYQLVPPGKPLLSLVAPFLIHTISVFSDLLVGLWGWGKTLAMENTRLTSFLALGCVFTLTKLVYTRFWKIITLQTK